jgi:Tfp pilus assembly protein PilF
VKQGKIKPAMTLLTAAVKKNPSHAASWVEMARIHQRAGDVTSARYCFQQSTEADKRSYVALQAWGVLESDLGNTAKARELLQRAIALSPRSVHSLQALATLEKREGNLEGAQRLLEEAIKVFPGATRAMAALAEVFEMRGEFKEAQRIFRMGQGRAESCGDAGFFQSWALLEVRRTYETNSTIDKVEEIRDIFKRAVKVNKYHSASW